MYFAFGEHGNPLAAFGPVIQLAKHSDYLRRPVRANLAPLKAGGTVKPVYNRRMPIDLESQILTFLRGMKTTDRPATFSDLARRFGTTVHVIQSCAGQMVDKGVAEPSMIMVRGSLTRHGLMPQPKAAPHA
jgi:hypothetical protein